MSLKTAVLKSGATMAPTGGTDVTFADYGSTGQNVSLAVPADTTFATRRTVLGSYKPPVKQASQPGGFTRAKSNLAFRQPKLLADGTYDYLQIKVLVEFPQEATDAEKTELLVIGSQMVNDADFTAFFKTLNTA